MSPLEILFACIAASGAIAAVLASLHKWHGQRIRTRQEESKKDFDEELHRELKILLKQKLPQPQKIGDHEVAVTRVLVKQVVLRIASKYGGVKVCCPPVQIERADPAMCKWCWDFVPPTQGTGKCPYCPLHFDKWSKYYPDEYQVQQVSLKSN